MIQLSIIIPMYNVADFLKTCIASILDQNLNDGEFEILMINDGSPDNSIIKAQELAKKHASIKIFSQENKGLGGARNTGIKNAKGMYLLFLDADDIYIQNSISTLLNMAVKKDVEILEFGAQGVDLKGKIKFKFIPEPIEEAVDGIEYYKKYTTINSACNKLYKNSFLKENNILFMEGVYGEDFEFNTRALYHAKKVSACTMIISEFLQSPESITRTKDLEKKKKYIQDYIKILRNLRTFKAKHSGKPNENYSYFFEERMTMINVNIFYQMLKYGMSTLEANEIEKQLKELNVFKLEHPVSNFKKELFRKYLLGHNLRLYKIALTLNNMILSQK